MLYDITIDGQNYRLDLNHVEGCWSCRLNSRDFEVDAVLARSDVLSLRVADLAYEVKSERVANELYLWVGSARFTVEARDPRSLRGRSRAADERGPRKITAPMPGKVVRLLVHEGEGGEVGRGAAGGPGGRGIGGGSWCGCGRGDEDAERHQIAEAGNCREGSGW